MCESAPSIPGLGRLLFIGKATDLLIVIVMVFVQSIAVLIHVVIIIFKLVIIPVPAMPALVAFPFLRIDTLFAW
jgi:hypothetical protein